MNRLNRAVNTVINPKAYYPSISAATGDCPSLQDRAKYRSMSDLLTLSDGHLISLAGIADFKRGLEYFQSGAVRECIHNNGYISGIVYGSSLYSPKLRHTSKHLEGQCGCMSSNEIHFCKHCVALTMHYRRELEAHNSLASGSQLDRIRAFVRSMSKSELQEALVDTIEDDPNLHNRWSVRADLALNKVDSKLIRKRITAAFPYNRHLFRRRQVKDYFAKAQDETELLAKQLPKLEAKKALQLLDYTFQRLQRALQTVDDSNGYRLELLNTLQQLHKATLMRSDWPASRVVRYLSELEDSKAHDYYPEIPGDYLHVLGSDGREIYLDNKQQQWDALPPLSFGATWEQLYPYLKIQSYLLKAARIDNDTVTEISLLEKTCVDPVACRNLCERLVELAQWEKLEFWLAKATRWEQQRSNVSHIPNLDFKRFTTELLIQKGRVEEALDVQWEIYQQSTITDDYKQLIRFAQLNDTIIDWKARVFRQLHKKIDDPNTSHFMQRTLHHLVELYLLERKPETALDLANYHSLSFQSLELLIKAFASQANITYPLYQQQLDLLLSQANKRAYKEAVRLIVACKANLQAHDKHYFDAMISWVRRVHKLKTHFQKLLDDALQDV